MLVTKIGTLEAKTSLSALLGEVQKGKVFHITKHGKPIAELRPIRAPACGPRAGFAKGTFEWTAADFDEPLEDFRDYMG